jgi:iron complex outermembrane receptor protein
VRTGEWVWRLQLREERTDGVFSPLLWDAGASWSASRQLTVRSSVSRNYRVPTINDLVWRPGGNPDLVPEEGLSAEAGVALDRPAADGRLQASVTGYVRRVDNWILWLPPTKDVRDYWSPVNIAEVRSQGLETRLAWSRTGKVMRWSVDAGLDLTWSRFEEDVPDLGIMAGDQMLYVPVENLQGGIRVGWRIVSLTYRHYWFGESPGINEQVQAGNVGTANLSVVLDRAPYALSAFVQVDNVWNVPYRLMERRPMPGRGVQVGLRVSWTGRKEPAAID